MNTKVFQFDNSGWPTPDDVYDALPDTFVIFPFEFPFTNSNLDWFRNGFTSTSLGFRWIYISDEKIFIHRAGTCCYQLKIKPNGTDHIAIYYFYDEVDKLTSPLAIKPKEELLGILWRWAKEAFAALMK